MKIKFLVVLFCLLLIIPSFSQSRIRNPWNAIRNPVIKVNGSMTYYGGSASGYLSYSLNFSRNGKPVKDIKVLINNNSNTYNNNPGHGWIGGSLSPYTLRYGDNITISIVVKKKFSRFHSLRGNTKKILLATLKVKNIIKWVYPRPGQAILLPNPTLSIPFRWNFTGSPVRTELYIRDKTTNTKIFSHIINGENQRIRANIFKHRRTYIMGFWANAPIDSFSLSGNASLRSNVKFYFCNSMNFSTK